MSTLTSPKRARRHNKNRDRILRAAALEVAEAGLHALSVKGVAARAGYSPGAIYRYYPSKDALLAAVVGQTLTQIAGAIADLPEPDPLRLVLAQFELYRDLSLEQPHHFTLISQLLTDPRTLVEHPSSLAEILQASLMVQGHIQRALERAVQEGALEPGSASDRAIALFASTQGVLQLRKQERRLPGVLDVDRLLDLTLNGLLRGWGADPDRLASRPTTSHPEKP